LLLPRSSSRRPIPRGSPAKRFVSREVFVRERNNELQK
jgi:hypothetical protein